MTSLRVDMHIAKAIHLGLLLKFLCDCAPSALADAAADPSSPAAAHIQAFDLPQSAYLSSETRSGHAFFYDPALPESRQVYSCVSNFYDAHLGTQ